MAQVPSKTLSEHEAPASATKPAGYNPTPEEQRAIRLNEKLYTDGKKAREKYDENWQENYRFFKGKQWKEKRPSYRHSEVINYVFSEVQNVLVILTDTRPNIECLPEDPSDYQFAEILSQILTSKWDSNNWSAVVAEAIVDAAIYGTAITEVPWKEELAGGLGDFTFETVDPFYFFIDSNARSKVNDEYCDHVTKAMPFDVGKLKKKYPEVADYLKADLGDMTSALGSTEDASEARLKSPIDNRVGVNLEKGNYSFKPNQTLYICSHLKSDETEEIEGQEEFETQIWDDESQSMVSQTQTRPIYQTQKKYPTGRLIETANGVLLYDGPNPDENGKFPYSRLVDHLMPREFWGIGEVEQMKSPQTIINKLVSYIMDVLILTGNPIWVVDTSAGIDTDNLTNQPGLVVEKNPGSEVRREEGVQLQPYVMQVLEFFIERVMTKLGSTNDTSKGVSPSSNASGWAIEQLQEASQTKLRGKSRNIEMWLKDTGDLMVDRVLQHYTIPRIVRLTNNEGAAQYFQFHMTETVDEQGETHKVANVMPYQQDGLGQYQPQNVQQFPVKSRLDVRISTGSSLPFAKAQKAQTAERLYDKGIIDGEEFLTQIEYPNREKIIQKLKEQQAMQPPVPPQGAPNAAPAAPAI